MFCQFLIFRIETKRFESILTEERSQKYVDRLLVLSTPGSTAGEKTVKFLFAQSKNLRQNLIISNTDIWDIVYLKRTTKIICSGANSLSGEEALGGL